MIEEIVEREWFFFQKVNNIGGRASCQDDPDTFYNMRIAQFSAYVNSVNQAYLEYLKECEQNGRNPLTEKYAYMMKDSDPEYYKTIQDSLPVPDEETIAIIEIIVHLQLKMREEFNQKYPYLASLARNTYSIEDDQENTSFETYLRGELMSYNEQTLHAYGNMMVKYVRGNKNLIEMIMENTVKSYHYDSLEKANNAYKNSFNEV